MADDPKSVADAILGPLPGSKPESETEESGEFDTETAALEATAAELKAAIKADDDRALVEVLRELVRMARS